MVPFSKYGYTPYGLQGKWDNFELTNKTPLSLVQEIIGGQEYYTLELDEHIIFCVSQHPVFLRKSGTEKEGSLLTSPHVSTLK